MGTANSTGSFVSGPIGTGPKIASAIARRQRMLIGRSAVDFYSGEFFVRIKSRIDYWKSQTLHKNRLKLKKKRF